MWNWEKHHLKYACCFVLVYMQVSNIYHVQFFIGLVYVYVHFPSTWRCYLETIYYILKHLITLVVLYIAVVEEAPDFGW